MTKNPFFIVVCLVCLVAGGIVTAIFIAPSSVQTAEIATDRRVSGGERRREYAPAVSMSVVSSAPVEKVIEVLGEARALRSVTVTSEVAGLVEEVAISPGKRVQKGELLLQIEDDDQAIALTRARAQFPIAKANAERYRALETEEAASALEAENAYNAFKTAEADLRAAEVALERRAVKAPFDGIVGLTTIEPGDYISTGDVIATLDDISSVIVEFSVPQESAGYINIGQPVTARLASGAGLSFDGEITAIDSRVDPASRTLRAEATIANANGRLIPGAVFAIRAVSEGVTVIAAPGIAVQWDRAGAYLWKRNEEGKAERASIVIVQRTDDRVLIEGDIAAGDAIVTEGADRVRAGLSLPDAAGKVSQTRATTAQSAAGLQ